MIKLNDILNVIGESQFLSIYVGDSSWVTTSAYAALKVINHKTLQRKVMRIEGEDSSVRIYLEQE